MYESGLIQTKTLKIIAKKLDEELLFKYQFERTQTLESSSYSMSVRLLVNGPF